MRHYFILITFSLLIFSCTAYESDFPIGDATNEVGCEDLIGEWYALKLVDGKMKMIHSIEIAPLFEKQGIIKATWFSTKEDIIQETNNFRLLKNRLDTINYLSIEPINNTKEKKFNIWKYKIIKDGMLKGYYLSPRLTKNFESKMEFDAFVLNQESNFDSYFDTLKLSYVRSHIYTWDVLNDELKLDELKSMKILKEDSIRSDFSDLSLEELEKMPSRNVQIPEVKEGFSNFHFVAGPKPMFDTNPKMAYFVFKNDEFRKLVIYKSKSQIYDIMNKRVYKLDERKSSNMDWLN